MKPSTFVFYINGLMAGMCIGAAIMSSHIPEQDVRGGCIAGAAVVTILLGVLGLCLTESDL